MRIEVCSNFWALIGDLNYRIDLERNDVLARIESKDIAYLRTHVIFALLWIHIVIFICVVVCSGWVWILLP